MGFSLGSIGNVVAGVGAGLFTGNPMVGLGVYSALSATDAQKEANETNVSLQRENRSWEEEMANTAHQREVSDLKAAGLNPILSVNKSGAVTPNIQPASVESLAPIYQNSARDVSASSMGYKNLVADLQVKRSQILANSAIAAKNNADANYANTSAIGTAFDNAKKEAELPWKVREALNRKWIEDHRSRRWGPVRAVGQVYDDFFGSVGKVFGGSVSASSTERR